MRKYTGLMLSVLLLTSASSLDAQGAALDAAIVANFGPAPIVFFGGAGATPTLSSSLGLTNETAIRNVQATLDAAGWLPFVFTTGTFAAPITWGHNANAATAAASEIAVATGTVGGGGGAGGAAVATNTFATGSAYTVGGHGSAPNGAGGAATSTSNGSDDCVAEAYGGDGLGTGNGGAAIADSAFGSVTSVGFAVAEGGATSGGIALGGNATATADGNAVALGGDADPNFASTAGDAASSTTNGSNAGTTATSVAGNGGLAGGAVSAAGPNSGPIGPFGGIGGSATGN